jgi:hypothetical protein
LSPYTTFLEKTGVFAMIPDAIFNVTNNGVITGSYNLMPGKTFVVCTPADDPYDGHIYAKHLDHNETLRLVGQAARPPAGADHNMIRLDIGKTYTVQPGTEGRHYQITTMRPPHRDRSQGPELSDPTGPHPTDGSNGDLTVGSGGM